MTPAPRTIGFHGGTHGAWQIERHETLCGPELAAASHIAVGDTAGTTAWTLRGFTSNLRYTTASERSALDARAATPGATGRTRAALIPIRKSPGWWALAQDERRAIYERAQHTPVGLDYLPAIARRLHHSRDLGQPFDFLTWFEFAPEHEALFDRLVARLRGSEEWRWVDAETDIRLVRDK